MKHKIKMSMAWIKEERVEGKKKGTKVRKRFWEDGRKEAGYQARDEVRKEEMKGEKQ